MEINGVKVVRSWTDDNGDQMVQGEDLKVYNLSRLSEAKTQEQINESSSGEVLLG